MREGRPDRGARRHHPLVRHGPGAELRGDPVLHRARRLGRPLHRHRHRAEIPALRQGGESGLGIRDSRKRIAAITNPQTPTPKHPTTNHTKETPNLNATIPNKHTPHLNPTEQSTTTYEHVSTPINDHTTST